MLRQTLVFVLVVFVCFTLFMYIRQRQMMYYPAREKPILSVYHADDMQEITLHTKDGLHLLAWYKPAKPNQTTVLFLHGNAGHIGHRMPLVRQLLDAGFGVLLLEYRGYGSNEGHPSEKGLYEDGQAAIRFLQAANVEPQQVMLFGESLGTGVATELAAQYPVCALVLQSPFTSMTDLARFHYPWVFLKPWDRFDSFSKIQSIHAPLLILHGTQDDIVPIAQARKLFAQAQEPKKMLEFNESSHNDMWDTPSYSQNIIQFANQYCQISSTQTGSSG